MSRDSKINADTVYEPGNNYVVLRKNNKCYYVAELFHKSPFIDQVTPLFLSDIFHKADISQIYADSAYGLYRQGIILISNYPVKRISLVARIASQVVSTSSKNSVEYIFEIFDSTSERTLMCVAKEHTVFESGLGTSEMDNQRTLLRFVGILRHKIVRNDVTNLAISLDVSEIHILSRDSLYKNLRLEIEHWRMTLDFRNKHFKSPWIITDLSEHRNIVSGGVNIDDMYIENNILIRRTDQKQRDQINLRTAPTEHSQNIGSSYDGLIVDSLELNRKKTRNRGNTHAHVEVISVESDKSDSEIEEIHDETLMESYIEAKQAELNRFSAINATPSFSQKRKKNARMMKTKSHCDTMRDSSIRNTQESENIFSNINDLHIFLNQPELDSFLIENIVITRGLIMDRHQLINKPRLALELIKCVCAISIDMKQQQKQKQKSEIILGKDCANLKQIYYDLRISNFLTLIILKYCFIMNFYDWDFTKEEVFESSYVKLDITIRASQLQKFRTFLTENINSESIEQFFKERRLINTLKSKVFHRIRHVLVNNNLLKGYVIDSSFTSNKEKVIYINYTNILIVKEFLKNTLKHSLKRFLFDLCESKDNGQKSTKSISVKNLIRQFELERPSIKLSFVLDNIDSTLYVMNGIVEFVIATELLPRASGNTRKSYDHDLRANIMSEKLWWKCEKVDRDYLWRTGLNS